MKMEKEIVLLKRNIKHQMKDRFRITLLVLNKFKQVNLFLFPLKSSENHRLSLDEVCPNAYVWNKNRQPQDLRLHNLFIFCPIQSYR